MTYLVRTGSRAQAANLARVLLHDHAGHPLPGEVTAPGDGTIVLDETAMGSLRGRLVSRCGDGEVLTMGWDTWPVEPAG